MRLLLLTGGKIKQPNFCATAHYLKDEETIFKGYLHYKTITSQNLWSEA